MMIEDIKRYFEFNKQDSFQRLDDETCQDLNLDELFLYLDYTKSSVGKQYLYNLLRNIPSRNIIAENEDWISAYGQNTDLKSKIEKLLSKLNSSDAYSICSLFLFDHPVVSQKRLLFYRILQFIPFTTLLLFIFFNSQIAVFALFASFILKLIIHYKTKQTTFVHSSSIPQLLKMLNIAKNLATFVSFKGEDINAALVNVKTMRKHFSLFRFESKLDSDTTVMVWFISEIYRIFFLLEPVALNKAFMAIQDRKDDVENIFRFVGLTDTLQSVAGLRASITNYCIPRFVSESELSAKGVYHPLIENCVKNSFSLDNRSFLIMGSNMSGKTSFMRTVAINVLSAQVLNTCFASGFTLQRQKIWTAITLGDSLTEGVSYYLSEVLRIKSILENCAEGANLIVIDELFKGTNTEERIAISISVLKYLVKNSNNIVLISTHDTKLQGLIDDKQYTLIHFKEIVEDNNLSFPYLIQEGKPTTRNAIKILELYKYPSEIVDEALNNVN